MELEARAEHLTNLLVGMNDKLHVFNDFKQDVENHKAMLKASEHERENWQHQVRMISAKVIVDSE
jgi:hypothetical protein